MGRVIEGDALEVLKTLEGGSVQCAITSPPYWRLRDYGFASQLGMEETLSEYLERLVETFREVRRVLRPDGTLWLNMGDAYSAGGNGGGGSFQETNPARVIGKTRAPQGLKPKDLIGLPWRVAFALQEDGWWLRSDIIWAKPNPMPESVNDRPTKSHEYLFLLSRSSQYFYNAEAIMERAISSDEAIWDNGENGLSGGKSYAGKGSSTRKFRQPAPAGWDSEGDGHHGSIHRDGRRQAGKNSRENVDRVPRSRKPFPEESRSSASERLGSYPGWRKDGRPIMRNKRTVWNIATEPYPGAHFATFPEALVTPCILAGSHPGDLVLDPFAGSGTTLAVAVKFGRDYIGIEGKPEYIELIQKRLSETTQGMPI